MPTQPEPLFYEREEEDNQSIEEYWTEERMANAIPIQLPIISPEELEALQRASDTTSKEHPSYIESSDEADNKLHTVENVRANVDESPFWNGGKFFFVGDDGRDYTGSAQFCGNNRILLTAAHCVKNSATGNWYKNFLFRRAYKGEQLFGLKQTGQAVTVKAIGVWDSYTDSNPAKHSKDYAWIVTNEESGAGWLGLELNIPYKMFSSIGYPRNFDNGLYMQWVVGLKGSDYASTYFESVVEMTPNPMTGGASGGAWITLTGTNRAIGLNSFIVIGMPNRVFGPYFDNLVFDLYSVTKEKI